MGNTVIEHDIVSMDFDPKGLKSGIDSALSFIDSFKKALNFDQNVKGLNDLDVASKNVNFGAMGSAIETVAIKLNALSVIATTVISKITIGVMDSVQSMFQTTFMQPLQAGLSEYETQMNSIQTILANTSMKGTTLDDVNGALGELNLYADKTIYNFTQMTDSIGKFTSAGVDLDTSVSAIKGISNLAALSGSNSQQAATAMYQLSQAIAAGKIGLQDWNSVVNAGMGGQVFQDALIETARNQGIAVDSLIEKNGSFRLSLQEGWLTSEVMLESLSKFTGDLNAEQLKTLGYTDDQIVEIMKLAETANDAATKIKTLTGLKDVMMESLQSGWAQTWTIVFGEFDEAKELFGSLGETFGSVISESAASRNGILKAWKDLGGRSSAIRIVFTLLETGIKILQTVRSGFAAVFPAVTGERLFKITKAIEALVTGFKMGAKSTNGLRIVAIGLASALKIALMFVKALISPFLALGKAMVPSNTGFLDMLINAAEYITTLSDTIEKTDAFAKGIAWLIDKMKNVGPILQSVVTWLLKFSLVQDIVTLFQSLDRSDFVALFERGQVALGQFVVYGQQAKVMLGVLVERFLALEPVKKTLAYLQLFTWDNFKLVLGWLNSQIPPLVERFREVEDKVRTFGDSIVELKDKVVSSAPVQKLLTFLQKFNGENLKTFLGSVKNGFGEIVDVLQRVRVNFDWLKSIGEKLAPIFEEMTTKVKEGLAKFFDSFTGSTSNFNSEKFGDVLTVGLLGGVLLAMKKMASGSWLTDILDKFFGDDSTLIQSLTGTLDAVRDSLVAWQTNVKADSLMKIAIAVGVITASVVILSMIDQAKLMGALTALAIMMGQLFGSAGILSKLGSGDLIKATIALGFLSAALLLMAVALAALGSIDQDTMADGIAAVTIALTQLVVGITAMSLGAKSDKLISTAIAMGILAGGLVVMSLAIRAFGSIDPVAMNDGLLRIGTVLVGFMAFSRTVDGKQLVVASIGIGAMSAALLMLLPGIAAFGMVPLDVMQKGLLGLGVTLGILAIAVNVMQGALAGAFAILVVSGAVLILAGALKIIGSMNVDDLKIALIGLAGALTIIGVAGAILSLIAPGLMGVGVAFILIGVGAALMGGGLFLAATGILAVAGSAYVVAESMGIMATAMNDVLPKLGEAIANSITTFQTTLASKAPELKESFKTLLLNFITAITETIPAAITAFGEMIMALGQYMIDNGPTFFAQGYQMLIDLLTGIRDNMQEITALTVEIIAEFIEGLADGTPELIVAAWNLVDAIGNGFKEALEQRWPEWKEKFREAALEIVNGLTAGIRDSITRLKLAIKEMGLAAVARIKDLLGIHSPSKVFYELASFVVDGFVNGITAGKAAVANSFNTMAQNSQNGINSVIDGIRTSMDNNLNFNPTIKPLLDMGDMNVGMRNIDDFFRGKTLRADLAGSIESKPSVVDPLTGSSSKEGITYVQNITSPKALDAGEIYRQTKMQISKFKKPEYSAI